MDLRKRLILLLIVLAGTLFLTATAVRAAQRWDFGFFHLEGQFPIELDGGAPAPMAVTGDAGLVGRYWLTADDALRIAGSLDTTDAPNSFILGLSYLTHFAGEATVRPFVGGGLFYADDIDGNDDFISLEGHAGFLWSPLNIPFSFALSTDLVSLVVEPESNFYVGKWLALELLYAF